MEASARMKTKLQKLRTVRDKARQDKARRFSSTRANPVEVIENSMAGRAARRAANLEQRVAYVKANRISEKTLRESAQISPVLFHLQLDQSTKLIKDSKVLLADPSGTQAEYQVVSFVMCELQPSTSASSEPNDAAGLLAAGRTFAIEAALHKAPAE